jgi:uncharacterized membrane protein
VSTGGQGIVVPSRDDPLVTGAVEVMGGPPGEHARVGERRFWTVTRVLVALTLLTSLFGWLQKAPCRDTSSWADQFQYSHLCYTDVAALYTAEGLSEGKRPYYDHPVEYPVVIGAVMQVSSLLARGITDISPDDTVKVGEKAVTEAATPQAVDAAKGQLAYRLTVERTRHFYDLTWLLLTVCALIVTVTTSRLAGRRRWDAAMFAVAPVLVIHGTTNWDLLAVAMAGLAMLAWAKKLPLIAGALLGLGAATKLYPLLFLVPLFFLCLRVGKLKVFAGTAVMAAVVIVGVVGPVYLTSPSFVEQDGRQVKVLSSPLDRVSTEGLSALKPHQVVDGVEVTNAVYRFVELNKTRPADWDSLHFQLQRAPSDTIAGWFTDPGSPPTKVNRWVFAGVVLVTIGIGVLTLKARRRPRVPPLLFLMTAGFLLVNKVDSPQYVTWLVPLAILAHPRWRPFLAWQATEVVVMVARFYMFINNDKPGEGLPLSWFFAAILLRDALLIGYMALVVRDVLKPERDVVRQEGVDDPAGGLLDGAQDKRDLSKAMSSA